MKRCVAEEVAHFLSETDKLKSEIDSMKEDDRTKASSIADSIIKVNKDFESSMIRKYLDPKTEIQVPLSHPFSVSAAFSAASPVFLRSFFLTSATPFSPTSPRAPLSLSSS